MGMRRLTGAFLLGLALLVIAGCFLPTGLAHDAGEETGWSTTPAGDYEIQNEGRQVFTASDGTEIHYGLWVPTEDGDPVDAPVIMSPGPYYGILDHDVTEPADRLGQFLIENYVPHGYAVAQVAVRGTEQSGGCMEFMSDREALDLHELATDLAEAGWSQQAVGVIGKSYDGGASWMTAKFGNEHVETVVPLAGVTDQEALQFRNGTSENRGPFFHAGVYWPYGFGATQLGGEVYEERSAQDRLANAACPEAYKGAAFGPLASATGTGQSPGAEDYWGQRDLRTPILENYEGSAFIVHGFWDWNVDPFQVIPFFTQLQEDPDIDAKLWMGQWGHHYPDRGNPGEGYDRDDFASVLLDWFDNKLKGENVDTGPPAEVQDRFWAWHTRETFPPKDTQRETFHLAPGATLSPKPATEASTYPLAATQAYATGQFLGPMQGQEWWCQTPPGSLSFETPSLEEGFYFSGNAHFHTTVQTTTGGSLYAELCIIRHNGFVYRMAKAEMNLLYASGGDSPEPFVPGLPFKAKMEFVPQDMRLYPGDRIQVNVYHQPFVDPLPDPKSSYTNILGGPGQETVLKMPVYDG